MNETLERVFRHIEESAKGSETEGDFAGLFDDYDVNSNKQGSTVAKRNEKLVKLLNGVGEMNLGDVKDRSIDAFGVCVQCRKIRWRIFHSGGRVRIAYKAWNCR